MHTEKTQKILMTVRMINIIVQNNKSIYVLQFDAISLFQVLIWTNWKMISQQKWRAFDQMLESRRRHSKDS